MQLFLNEFSKTLDQEIIIVMDNAGWHHGLALPSTIQIVYLPPYSPELNPVERLWQYIKNHVLKNKVYDTLKNLEDNVCAFVEQLLPATVKSVCNCSYVKL
jgi:transposase